MSTQEAYSKGQAARERAGASLKSYTAHSFDTPKTKAVHEDKRDLRLFTGIPYFFYKQGFDFADCIGLARIFYACHGWSAPIEDIHNFSKGGRGLTQLWDWSKGYFDSISPDSLEYGDIIIVPRCGLYVFLDWIDNKALTLGYRHDAECVLSVSSLITLDIEQIEKGKIPFTCLHRIPRYCEPYELTEDDIKMVTINHIDNPYTDIYSALAFRGYDEYQRNKIMLALQYNASRRP